MSAEQSDFQKSFFAKGTGGTLFTQREFDDALAEAKAELIVHAIEATKYAVVIEREECAKICDKWSIDLMDGNFNTVAEEIRNRIPSQHI